MRILYMDDEPNDIHLVDLYVKSTSHELIVAEDLEKFDASLDTQPDLILIDIMINRSRIGLQLPQKVRQQGHDVPLIAVTGLTTADDLRQCQTAGFDHVLTKPFSILQLANVIKRYEV